jgi:threonine dehydrogenase-like Zn-dependent dehydrogenase
LLPLHNHNYVSTLFTEVLIIISFAELENVEKFAVKQKEIPIPKPNEVLVSTKFVGVCGSDLHVYLGSHPKVKPPAILGHECTGVILNGNHHFPANVPVAINPLIGCGTCEHCQMDQTNICLSRTVIGFQKEGGLSQVIAVPRENILPLSKDFSLRTGILYEPLGVVIHAVKLANLNSHQDVIITGAGTIGLLTGIYIRDKFNVNVSFIEINQKRIDLASSLGFSVYTKVEDLILCSNHRPIFFECTGNIELLKSLLSYKPAAAEIIIVSTFHKEHEIPVFSLLPYEISVKGSQMYTKQDLKQAIDILSTTKRSLYEAIVMEHDYGYHEVNDAYESTIKNTQARVKAIINMSKGE